MPETTSFTFTIAERLKSRRMIGSLFTGTGEQAFLAYPLRVVWLPFPDHFFPTPTAKIQVMVSAPKKQFKTANARNRIKRLVREAWRLHKHEYYQQVPEDKAPIALLLMYIAKEELTFAEIEAGVVKAIRKLLKGHIVR